MMFGRQAMSLVTGVANSTLITIPKKGDLTSCGNW